MSDARGVLGSTPQGSVALDGGAAGLLTKVLGKINIPAGGRGGCNCFSVINRLD